MSKYNEGYEAESSGDIDRAKELYAHAVDHDGDCDAAVNLGRLLHGEGDLTGALDLYEFSIKRRPGDSIAVYNKGVVLEDLDNDVEAAAMYRHAAFLNPKNGDAWFNLSGVCLRLGLAEEADRAALTWSTLAGKPIRQAQRKTKKESAMDIAKRRWKMA